MMTTERREKRIEQIADAAMMVDVNTGEIIPAKKAAAPKLPHGVTLIEGETCPDCGEQLALARRDGKQFKVCITQFNAAPECWYAEEIKPKIIPMTAEEKEAMWERLSNISQEQDTNSDWAEWVGAQFKTGGKAK